MRNSIFKGITTTGVILGATASYMLGVTLATPAQPSPTTVSLQRMAQPAEDDPRFDCRYHGNRQCAVRLDPKPSDGKSQSVWYVIQFKGNPAKPVSVKPRGF